MKKQKYAVIVAGGKGQRMNTSLPKQFLVVGKKPVLIHTLETFYRYDNRIELILVLPSSQVELWKKLCLQYSFSLRHRVVEGGEERFHSVRNALATVPDDCLVAIHDGVRPFVSMDTLARCFALAETSGAAVPVVPPADSLRMITADSNRAVARADYRLVQTPQVFCSTLLKKAYCQSYRSDFTDDASVMESAGHSIHLCEGNPENMKLTTPFDLLVAQAYFNAKSK